MRHDEVVEHIEGRKKQNEKETKEAEEDKVKIVKRPVSISDTASALDKASE